MMSAHTPRLEIFDRRIEENARAVLDLCHRQGVGVACVTKAVMAHPAVVRALISAGADMLADSRMPNLQKLQGAGASLPRMLVRAPMPGEAAQVLGSADVSLHSSLETLKQISRAACAQKKRHQVIVMVDVGDLREGAWPGRVPTLLKAAARLPGLDVLGLGCNLACFGGVVPTPENMDILVRVRETCRRLAGLELPVLSGGNSANLPLLASGGMPAEINQLRIGETILLGRNVLDRSPWPGTRQDTFRVCAGVIEVERKPSTPVGRRGQDAFGGMGVFVERGMRRRAVCNIGRQDTSLEGLTPEDPGVIVLGGSSDHLVLDVEEAAQKVEVGGTLGFRPNYAALLGAITSPFVQKITGEA